MYIHIYISRKYSPGYVFTQSGFGKTSTVSFFNSFNLQNVMPFREKAFTFCAASSRKNTFLEVSVDDLLETTRCLLNREPRNLFATWPRVKKYDVLRSAKDFAQISLVDPYRWFIRTSCTRECFTRQTPHPESFEIKPSFDVKLPRFLSLSTCPGSSTGRCEVCAHVRVSPRQAGTVELIRWTSTVCSKRSRPHFQSWVYHQYLSRTFQWSSLTIWEPLLQTCPNCETN